VGGGERPDKKKSFRRSEGAQTGEGFFLPKKKLPAPHGKIRGRIWGGKNVILAVTETVVPGKRKGSARVGKGLVSVENWELLEETSAQGGSRNERA